MTKAKSNQVQLDPSDFDTVSEVARIIEVPRTTLSSAVERSEVDFIQFGESLICLVSISSARAWNEVIRKPGRKPAD